MPDNNIAVSVIIPVYNSARYLAEALDSVVAQTFTNYEIILVDDGSTDNSKEIIEEYVKQHGDKSFIYLYQSNRGIAGARNSGIRISSGRYIALLDADDLWHPQRLEEGVAILDKSPKVGLVHSGRMRISADGTPQGVVQKPARPSGRIFKELVLRRASIGALTVLFRRECCDKVGLFREARAYQGVDDRDLWQRIAFEYDIAYIDRILAYWRCHDGNYSKNMDSMVNARLIILRELYDHKLIGFFLYRRAVARVYKELGDVHMFSRAHREARSNYQKSVLAWPLEVFSYINCVKTILAR